MLKKVHKSTRTHTTQTLCFFSSFHAHTIHILPRWEPDSPLLLASYGGHYITVSIQTTREKLRVTPLLYHRAPSSKSWNYGQPGDVNGGGETFQFVGLWRKWTGTNSLRAFWESVTWGFFVDFFTFGNNLQDRKSVAKTQEAPFVLLFLEICLRF